MRTAIVTGASRGLGRAVARDLAGGGWRVVVDARDAVDLATATGDLAASDAGALDAGAVDAGALDAGALDGGASDAGALDGGVSDAGASDGGAGGAGAGIVAVAGDLADPRHRARLVSAAGARVDAVVLNASGLGPTPLPALADVPLAAVRDLLEVNLVAQLALVQLVLPAVRAARGRVLAVSSDAAVEGYQGWGTYGATKAALEQVAKVLAAEEPELRVYAFDPGDMRTRMHADAFPGADISDRPEPETVVPAVRRLLTGELGSGRYTAAGLLAAVPS
jgi:NAD(P)-dependent dehydrogenase (short-subunit alcohol dehydrogenase family)